MHISSYTLLYFSRLLTSYPEKYRGPLYLFIYVYMNVVLINHDYVYKDWHQLEASTTVRGFQSKSNSFVDSIMAAPWPYQR